MSGEEGSWLPGPEGSGLLASVRRLWVPGRPLRRWWGALAVAACVALFYYDWLLGRAFIWEDLVYQWYPALSHLGEALRQGRMPLWNPGLRCGMPFFSDVQTGVFYPPHWLSVLFVEGGRVPWLAYQWYLVAHVLVAGLGTFLLLREQGRLPAAAAVGGVTFSLSGFMAMQVTHAPFLLAYSWMPAGLFCVRRFVNGGGATALLGIWLAVTLSFLAGCPQMTLYGSLLVAAYWAFEARRTAPPGAGWRVLRGTAIRVVLVFALVLMVGAPVLLPSLADWGGSGRSTYTFAQIADSSVPWYYLSTLVFPNFFGIANGSGEGVAFWGVNRDSIEFQTWKMAPWQYWESAGYAGQLAVLGLAVALLGWGAWRSRPEVRFFAVWALFCLWFMLGRYGGLFQVLYSAVPGLGMFRGPSRMSCGLDLAMAVLAANLVDGVLRGESVALVQKVARWAFFGCLGFLVLFLAVGQGWAKGLKEPANFDNAGFAIARAVAICGVLLWWVRDVARGGRAFGGVLASALPVLVAFADLYLAHAHFHRGRQNPAEYYADRMGIVPRIREMQRTEGPFRFVQMREGRLSEEVVFPRNAAYVYPGLEVPEGYVTFTPKRIGEFHAMKNESAKLDIMNARLLANVQEGRLVLGMNTNALPRAKVYYAREEFGSWPEMLAALEAGRLDYRNRLGLVKGESGDISGILAGGAEVPAPVSIERVTPERMRLRTRMAAPGAIFVSQTYYSGWRARDASGRELRVVPGFGAFTAILVPSAGDADIAFEYHPRELVAGVGLSLIGAAGVGALWWVLRRREGPAPRFGEGSP
ncbi:MAG TPA: hypothetical protein PLU30_16710 [Verrucomicrobiae bacterium]|nr:hypothetical protein [Verrucomicrobiae bacterium]